MFEWYRTGSHTVTSLKAHIVWCTKYRYKVLTWDIKVRCRDIIKQICDSLDINILKWVVSDDHIHIFIEYPTKWAISDIVKRVKWKTSNYLQDEYQDLKKRYWWQHLWAIWYFCASSWNITDDMINEYLEHHRTWIQDITSNNTFILE
jgi:putative transposase